MYCVPPSEVSYVIKPGCTRHKPYPLGLCSDCQPPTVTLARQKFRSVVGS
jgi:nuclear protein localization family protein 4